MIGNDENNKLVLQLAPLIYGRYWRTDMATHLGVSPRTVFSWSRPECNIPHVVMVGLEGCKSHNLIYDRKKKIMRRKTRGE